MTIDEKKAAVSQGGRNRASDMRDSSGTDGSRSASAAGAGSGGGRGRGDGAGPGRGARRGVRGNRQDVVAFAQRELEGDLSYVLCCVDDTDDLSGATSTGYVAELIAERVAGLDGRVVLGISRHQLLLAEGVSYTSHNSSMCFAAVMPSARIDELRAAALDVIAHERAKTSDPGLCIAAFSLGQRRVGLRCVPDLGGDPEVQRAISRLVSFGLKAKEVICTKEEAYALARDTPWVWLSEHGGTGEGVIGALAGVGLRLSGSDGRFRGKWDLIRLLADERARSADARGGASRPCERELVDPRVAPVSTVEAACARLASVAGGPAQVVDETGVPVSGEERLVLSDAAKPIVKDGALTLVVERAGDAVRPCTKVDLGSIGNDDSWLRYCDRFEMDNDCEECDLTLRRSCRNCLYRRWTARGFMCVA